MAGEIQKNELLNEAELPSLDNVVEDDLPRVESEPPEGLSDTMQEQDREAVEFAAEFLKKVLRLRGVRIEREKFLRAELHKRGIAAAIIDRSIKENPAAAGITPVMLDEVAKDSIDFETRKSTSLSFAAGLPGGFAMIGTVPADLSQFYIHAFRIMQKVAYTYGWQSFLNDAEDIDDETLGKLASFLGVMLGVAGASASVTAFAAQVARPAIQKKITSIALTKTSWYMPMKQTLKIVGVQVTKKSFASAATKVVPVVGGVLSGGLTFVTLGTQARRLMNHLREIPPPNVDAAEYLRLVQRAEGEYSGKEAGLGGAVGKASSSMKDGAAGAAGKIGSFMRRAQRGTDAVDAVGDADPVDGVDLQTGR